MKYAILDIFSGIKLIKNSSKNNGIKLRFIEITTKLKNKIINKLIFKKLYPNSNGNGINIENHPFLEFVNTSVNI